MLSVVIVAAAFIWVFFFIFGVVTLSCAQLVALSLQGAPGLPGAAILFILVYVALASLWLIDVMRPKTGRTGVIRRIAEGLLIAACLYTSLVHYALLRPMTPEGRIIMAVYEGPGSVFRAGEYIFYYPNDPIESAFGFCPENSRLEGAITYIIPEDNLYELGCSLTDDQRRARRDYALGPAGPAWHPLQSAGGRCTCLNRRDEDYVYEHRLIDWHEAEGIGDPAVLAAWRGRLEPRPQIPGWCEAALAPVRYPY